MKRRHLLTGAAGAWVARRSGMGWAQAPARIASIGWLGLNSLETAPHQYAAFRQGLRERGWVEGRDVVIDARRADGRPERLPALAAELARLHVDVIVATSSVATRAAMAATRSIPIVMASSANALGEGFVASLARPAGNVTGMTFMAGPEIAGKQLELLFELAPAASRIAVLSNPSNGSHAAFVKLLRAAAPARNVRLLVVEASAADQLDPAFAAFTKEGASALLVLTDGFFLGQHRRLVELAASGRLPAMYSQREYTEAGGLASYGPNLADMFRRAATHVDKILKGAAPGDIPVEQPTKFELVVNAKTAKALGIAIPASLLLRADEVIE